MAIADKSFVEHSQWLAFQRNRFEWPKHWQVVIFKISKEFDVVQRKDRYMVLPANPEYQQYLDEVEVAETNRLRGGTFMWTAKPEKTEFPAPPPMHLGPVEFDSMEDINQWALVAHRLR